VSRRRDTLGAIPGFPQAIHSYQGGKKKNRNQTAHIATDHPAKTEQKRKTERDRLAMHDSAPELEEDPTPPLSIKEPEPVDVICRIGPPRAVTEEKKLGSGKKRKREKKEKKREPSPAVFEEKIETKKKKKSQKKQDASEHDWESLYRSNEGVLLAPPFFDQVKAILNCVKNSEVAIRGENVLVPLDDDDHVDHYMITVKVPLVPGYAEVIYEIEGDNCFFQDPKTREDRPFRIEIPSTCTSPSELKALAKYDAVLVNGTGTTFYQTSHTRRETTGWNLQQLGKAGGSCPMPEVLSPMKPCQLVIPCSNMNPAWESILRLKNKEEAVTFECEKSELHITTGEDKLVLPAEVRDSKCFGPVKMSAEILTHVARVMLGAEKVTGKGKYVMLSEQGDQVCFYVGDWDTEYHPAMTVRVSILKETASAEAEK
jgi:hypothetical protein